MRRLTVCAASPSPSARHRGMRVAVLDEVAQIIAALPGARPIVAIDGVDGAGKTCFADELAIYTEKQGRQVLRASIDGFHYPRAVRYRRGPQDPLGFFLDSYDYESFRTYLINPFLSGAAKIHTARFDHVANKIVSDQERDIPEQIVMIVDGIFLHREELNHLWSFSIFLDVPFDISVRRLAHRDGGSPDPTDKSQRRYVEGQRIYLTQCSPQSHASMVIENGLLDAPRITQRRSNYI